MKFLRVFTGLWKEEESSSLFLQQYFYKQNVYVLIARMATVVKCSSIY